MKQKQPHRCMSQVQYTERRAGKASALCHPIESKMNTQPLHRENIRVYGQIPLTKYPAPIPLYPQIPLTQPTPVYPTHPIQTPQVLHFVLVAGCLIVDDGVLLVHTPGLERQAEKQGETGHLLVTQGLSEIPQNQVPPRQSFTTANRKAGIDVWWCAVWSRSQKSVIYYTAPNTQRYYCIQEGTSASFPTMDRA